MESPIWIPGIPATYSTEGEKNWKAALLKSIPAYSGEMKRGIILKFSLSTLTSKNNKEKEIDNLCQPVFSVIVGQRGWFEGKKTNIKWWRASKACTYPHGLLLSFQTGAAPNMINEFGTPIFNAVYTGELPHAVRKVQKIPFVDWLAEKNQSHPKAKDRFIALLQFSNSAINIGEIPTGAVKHIIDCLWPIIGKRGGHSDDRLIDILQVEKNSKDLVDGSLKLCIWKK